MRLQRIPFQRPHTRAPQHHTPSPSRSSSLASLPRLVSLPWTAASPPASSTAAESAVRPLSEGARARAGERRVGAGSELRSPLPARATSQISSRADLLLRPLHLRSKSSKR